MWKSYASDRSRDLLVIKSAEDWWNGTSVSWILQALGGLGHDFFTWYPASRRSAFLPETLKSYLFTSIRNLALNQLDKIDPLRQACDVAYYDSPWNEYDNFEDEVFRRVEEELEKLTPRAQDVIRKIYLEGMKYKDVADKLGISVATVNSILVRALKKLRQQADNKDE